MKILTLILMSVVFATVSVSQAQDTFTTVGMIQAIRLDAHPQNAATKPEIKKLALDEAIKVLTHFKRVTKVQYLMYAHQFGVPGSVTLNNGDAYLWEIEPEYAAVVVNTRGEKVYLLHPRLVK